MVIQFIMTEVDIKSSHTTEEQSFECYSSADEEKRPTPEDVHPSCFVNDAAIAWHENRREWVGDQSQRSKRVPRDSVISWSMTYEDLLSTNEPFQEPIPLPEMVDFLVDIWYDEGLSD
ncbi:hypothetical protein Nepgr_015143 [Nepenthes gracilis]|uniref:Gag1-like clamp domain-containing protein n=1 Tax=Nepenthes gracilis TaxID=150966 RepID=A0AAD3XQ59_NEPGR|nr:hypothetical protein Nepgr_015143 [Nepenthes gracilis]